MQAEDWQKKLNEQYETLTSKTARKSYDDALAQCELACFFVRILLYLGLSALLLLLAFPDDMFALGLKLLLQGYTTVFCVCIYYRSEMLAGFSREWEDTGL